MATALHNLSVYDCTKVPDASNMCIGIVVAEWNPEITEALLDGCVSTLEKHGALPENIHVKTVPGSFELIYGAHQMTRNDGYDAIIIDSRLEVTGFYEKLGYELIGQHEEQCGSFHCIRMQKKESRNC